MSGISDMVKVLMTRSRRWSPLLALLLGTSLLAGCGSSGSGAPAGAGTSPSPVAAGAPSGGTGGTAGSDGAGSGSDAAAQAVGLPSGTSLAVTDTEAGDLPRELISFVSPVLTLTPAGRLPTPAVVQLRLDNALPEGTPVFVARRDDASQPWSWIAGRLTSDLRHVEFTTDRLGQVGAVSLDSSAVVADAVDTIRSSTSDGTPGAASSASPEAAAALQQACAGGAAARGAGYSLQQVDGASLSGCLGTRQGHVVLTVANDLAFPVGLAHGGIPVVPGTAASVPDAWTPWRSALGDGDGGSATVLAPGARTTYAVDLPPSGTARLQTTASPAAAALRLLRATIDALGRRLELFGTGDVDVDRTLGLLVAAPSCSRAVQAAEATTVLTDCLSVDRLTQVLGDRAVLLSPVLTSSVLESTWADRMKAVLTRVAGSEQQRFVVRRAAPAFTGIAGVWVGPGRTLTITPDGVATESVRTPTGAPLIDLTYQLTDPATSGGTASASATLTRVTLSDPQLFTGRRPQAGDRGQLRIDGGVVTPPFLATTYCGRPARAGACG